jgi:hypothetical protein
MSAQDCELLIVHTRDKRFSDNCLSVSTPTPHNLSDEDITRGSVSAKNPLQPTTVNYEIHLADLIFLVSF